MRVEVMATDLTTTDFANLSNLTNTSTPPQWQLGGGYQVPKLNEQLDTVVFSSPGRLIGIVLSWIGIIVNVICLLGIFHIRSQRFTVHISLIVSLGFSDLFICIGSFAYTSHMVGGPYYDTFTDYACSTEIIRGLNMTVYTISLLNLLAMAIDHYVGILWPFFYDRSITKRRVAVFIVAIWILALLVGFSDFFTPYSVKLAEELKRKGVLHHCVMIAQDHKYNPNFPVYALAVLSLVVMSVIYVRIYMEVRRIQRETPGEATCAKLRGDRKALVTTLLFLGVFMLCWLPLTILDSSLSLMVRDNSKKLWIHKNTEVLREVTIGFQDFFVLNALLDPLIYMIRMRDIRKGMVRLFSRCSYFGRCCRGQDGDDALFPQSSSRRPRTGTMDSHLNARHHHGGREENGRHDHHGLTSNAFSSDGRDEERRAMTCVTSTC